MTTYVSWIKSELASRFPEADLSKGVDLNKNGKLERNERLIDANKNNIVGDHRDWLAFYAKNAKALVKMGGMFAWGKAFKPDNPIHDVIYMNRDLATDDVVQKAYDTLASMLASWQKRIARGNFTTREKLKIVYDIIRLRGIKIEANKKEPLFIQNLLSKWLDCDTSSFIVRAFAHEGGIRTYLTDAPEHVFVRAVDSAGKLFNIDNALIRSDADYVQHMSIAAAAVKQGAYLRTFARKEFLSLLYYTRALAKGQTSASSLVDVFIPYAHGTAGLSGPGMINSIDDALRDIRMSIALNPRQAAAWFVKAHIHMVRKERAKALACLEKTLALDPNMHQALAARATFYHRARRNREAMRDITRAIKRKGEAAYYTTRAGMHVAAKRYRKALRDLSSAILRSPTAIAYAQRARVLLMLKRNARSLADIDRAIRKNPANLQFRFFRVQVYLNMRRFPQAIAALSTLLSLGGDVEQTYFMRGRVYLTLKKYAKAQADFKRLLALGVSHPLLYSWLARSNLELGNYREALADCNKVIDALGLIQKSLRVATIAKLPPHIIRQYVPTFLLRGRAYAQLKQRSKALADYNTVIGLLPRHEPAYLARAVLRADEGTYEAALKDFRMAISIEPSDGEAWRRMADLHASRGAHAEAIKAYGKAIALAPNDADLYVKRAKLHAFAGKNGAAVRDLSKAIALKPKRAPLHVLRGEVLINASRYNDAIDDFNRAIAIEPKNADAYFHRGRAYRFLGKRDRALRDVNKAIALKGSHDADYHYERGLLLARSGRRGAARSSFQRARAANPEHIGSRRAIARSRYIPDITVALKPRVATDRSGANDALSAVGARWNVATLHRGLNLGITVQLGYAGGERHHALDAAGGLSLGYEVLRSRVSLDAGAGYAVHLAGDRAAAPVSDGGFFTYGIRYEHRVSRRLGVGASVTLQHGIKDPKRFAVVPGAELTFDLW